MEYQELGFKQVYWEEVREQIWAINQPFAQIIDSISPDKNYPLVKARYRYGDIIVKNGITYLPNIDDLSLLPATDPIFEKHLRDRLNYSAIPLFLILNNASEVYICSHQRTVPLNLFYSGSLLGLFECLDMWHARKSIATWSVAAGAKTLFMLPKLNDQTKFKKLRMAYDISYQLQPRCLANHWQLFKAIAQHKNFSQPSWRKSKVDPGWAKFKDYLVMNAWHQAQFAISKMGLNHSWEYFLHAMVARNLKPTPYLIDQVKHILLIALGQRPGFKPAEQNNLVAPIDDLQQAIANIYDLKKHLPTLLHINSLEMDSRTSLYYSLSFPTLLEGLPYHPNITSTIIVDIRNIKHIIDIVTTTFNQFNNHEIKQLSQIGFEYFHVEPDPYGEILSSQQLPVVDEKLLALNTKFPDRSFCATSKFWRGCIRISRK
jgi:hypothetical protein